MAQIFRVERTKNYTVMSNHHFKNKKPWQKKESISMELLWKKEKWLLGTKINIICFCMIVKKAMLRNAQWRFFLQCRKCWTGSNLSMKWKNQAGK